MKPGYKTTEFWVTILTQIASIAVLLGIVEPQAGDAAAAAVPEAVESVFALLAMAGSAWGYARSRGEAKKVVVMPASVTEIPAAAVTPVKPTP